MKNVNKKTSIKNKWSGLSSLTKILIGACAAIILTSTAGIVIGGVETSWKFSNNNNTKNLELNKNTIQNIINDYLKNAKPWYENGYGIDKPALVTFSIKSGSIKQDIKKTVWYATLNPPKPYTPTSNIPVSLVMNWIVKPTQEKANDNIDRSIKNTFGGMSYTHKKPTQKYFINYCLF